jgi:hypothetical protein
MSEQLPSWHPKRNGTTFGLGHKVGRPKGAQDRLPADLKKSFVDALRSFGSDGQGKDEIEGFIHYAIRNDLRGVLTVMAKIIPLQIHADVASSQITSVIINSVPPNHFMKEDPQSNDGVIIEGRAFNG